MNGRTFGILLGLMVLGTAFAGGASAAEDLSENPADNACGPSYPECDFDGVVSGADGPITADDPITADAPITGPITSSAPITSLETTPLSGCCCCEWRYNPSLEVLSEFRAH